MAVHGPAVPIAMLPRGALRLLPNLRDLGGLSTRDGRVVASGRLYRSATPMFVDVAAAHVLVRDLGLRVRIDLRREGEIADGSSPALAAVERTVVHAPIRAGTGLLGQRSAPRGLLAERYQSYLECSPEAVARVVLSLATQGSLPALVHCSAGKDRTGVVVALVLATLGVPDDQIVADYVRTAACLEDVLRLLRGVASYSARLAALPEEAVTARAETMLAFLAELDRRYGGARGYLTKAGVAPRTFADLETALLET